MRMSTRPSRCFKARAAKAGSGNVSPDAAKAMKSHFWLNISELRQATQSSVTWKWQVSLPHVLLSLMNVVSLLGRLSVLSLLSIMGLLCILCPMVKGLMEKKRRCSRHWLHGTLALSRTLRGNGGSRDYVLPKRQRKVIGSASSRPD